MAGHWWSREREGDLVGYLSNAEHTRLLDAMELATAAAGSLVLHKGSPSRSLILVESGEMEILDPHGDQVLDRVGPGSVVGEVGFVDGETRTHHVRAGSDCKLRRLTREKMLDLATQDPLLFAKITLALAELVSRRFRRVVSELEPVRAFAATLGEPMEAEHSTPADYDEIDEPLPEGAVEMLREVARRSQRNVAGA